MKKITLIVGALVALSAVLIISLDRVPKTPPRQSILLITVDALRADHVGLYGYPRNTTPHLDALGRESAVFLNAYSHSPWTHPSLASIHTGLHSRDHGITQWYHILNDNYTTLAEVFREHGYITEAYVTHITFRPEYGYAQGFDYYDHSALQKGYPHFVSSSREVTDKIIGRLDGLSKPFFIWVHYFDPHHRYLQHKGLIFGKRPIDRYDSEVAYTDHHIGRLLDALKERGLYEDTVVVVTADHGEEFADHGGAEHTRTLYEEVLRIPLIIKVPGLSRQKVEEAVVESDIAGTLLKLSGVGGSYEFLGDAIPFDGKRFTPVSKPVYAETRYRANFTHLKLAVNATCIIDGSYKLIVNHKNGRKQLFNLRADPREKNNLVDEEPTKAEELYRRLHKFYEKPKEAERHKLSEEAVENLRDLGYLI